ncbi:MAG: SAM-dependent methyltransferase [Actinomycetota bacterium]
MSAPEDETARFWDGHYGQKEQVWSGRPNAVLVEEIADLRPGKALDLGCGEGADAIWLARRGWQVTAVDVSRVALDRAVAAAQEAGVEGQIEWQLHDLAKTFPEGAYDLVSAHYLHAPIELAWGEILRRAISVVAPGGIVLVVGHLSHPSWAHRGHEHPEFPQPHEVAEALGLSTDDWVDVVCEARRRDAVGPRGEPGTITDSVVRARRRG